MSRVTSMARPVDRIPSSRYSVVLSVLTVVLLLGPLQFIFISPTEGGSSGLQMSSDPEPFGLRATYYSNHPRLLFRDTDTNAIIAKCQNPTWQTDCNRLMAAGFGIEREIPSYAMRYIINGNTADADHVITLMLAANQFQANGTLLADLALGFDWLYNYTGFDATEKTNVIAKITAIETQVQNSLFTRHIFARDMAESGAIGMAGLALMGHNANAATYVTMALENITNVMQGLDYLNGSWPEGLWFLNKERLPLFLEFLESYKTATEPSVDLFADIEANQHDWLHKLLYFHIYNWMPYGEFARFGDTKDVTGSKYYRQNLDLIVAKIRDPAGMDLINLISLSPNGAPAYTTGLIFKFILFYDPTVTTGGLSSLPNVMWFGPNTLDYVVSRTGWGPNDEVITFRSGDGFANHEHLDSGAFTITRGQPLAIDSGTNATFGTEHRENYYLRSVAHNTMQIRMDNEPFQCPAFGGWCSNDWGQRIYSYNPSYQTQETDATLAQYLASKNAGTHFETGNIIDLEVNPDYIYIQGNYTQSYNNMQYKISSTPKVAMVTRQVVLFSPEWMVVKDRLYTAMGTYKTRFPLHVMGDPTVNGTIRGYDEGGAPSYDGETITAPYNGATLFARTVYPEIHRTIDRTGSGREYWSDSANRAAGALADPMGGSGRIDVEDQVVQVNHEYLHVMNIQPVGGATTMPEVVRINEPYIMGAYFNNTAVLFSRNDKSQKTASVNLTQNGTVNFHAFDMVASSHYQIMNIHKKTGKIDLLEAASSPNGTLDFSVTLSGDNQVVIGWTTDGDISIDSMSYAPAKPNNGDNITFNAVVKNKSTYSFSMCAWAVDFFLGNPDSGGSKLGSSVVDVYPLSTKSVNFTTKVPWNSKSQQVYSRLRSNTSCAFVDSDTTDNQLYSWVYINALPIPVIVAPAEAYQNEEVSFDGSQSFDVEGMLKSRTWNWGDGSPDTTGAIPVHKYWLVGNFTVRLTIVDMNGVSNSTTHKIMIKPIRRTPSPYFDMHTDPPVAVGNITTLYIFNSTSVDLDNAIEYYLWDFGDGTNATGPNVTHKYERNGYYNISMTIGWNKTQTATAWWHWLHIMNLGPRAAALVNQSSSFTTYKGLPVVFNASGTTDPDDDPVKDHTYRWFFDPNDTNDYQDGIEVVHWFHKSGTYPVRLMVQEVVDNVIYSDNATVLVTIKNRSPKANISCTNFTLEWNQLLWVDGWRSSDPDGDLLKFVWDFGDDTTPARTMIGKHYYAQDGNFSVTLTVTDEDGAKDTATIKVTQKPQPPPPPPPPPNDDGAKRMMYYIIGAGIGIGVALSAVAAVITMRRKRDKEAQDAKAKAEREAAEKAAQDAANAQAAQQAAQEQWQAQTYYDPNAQNQQYYQYDPNAYPQDPQQGPDPTIYQPGLSDQQTNEDTPEPLDNQEN